VVYAYGLNVETFMIKKEKNGGKKPIFLFNVKGSGKGNFGAPSGVRDKKKSRKTHPR
jgi:hypothetical protein